jgi:signal transduction histidine kinase
VIVEQTIRQVRDLALDLCPSPLDDLGLGSAWRSYTERLTKRTALKSTVAVDDDTLRCRLEVETTAFRVAQEALTNIERHAPHSLYGSVPGTVGMRWSSSFATAA